MSYFLYKNNIINNKKRELIFMRKNRKSILNKPGLGKLFTRGDIVTLNFWTKTLRYHFEGLCLSLKKKSFNKPEVTLILRNILFGIGIEISISYFFNRLYLNIFMSDFKRKNFNYRSSKLYYLRLKDNQATKIKS